MIRIGIFIFLFCLNLNLPAQWTEVFHIEEKTDFFEVDNLLNIYRVQNTELFKYDKDGNLKFRYSDKQLGEIGAVDVSYPLRPLVVYPELNYIVLLDNTLSNNRGKINLLDYNIGLGTLAINSVQNHFWVYDAMNFSLLRLNENFKPVNNTGNLSQVLGIELNPTVMKEFANKLYLNNPGTGILVFDIYGTYIKTIPLKNLKDFQVFENEIVYLEKGKLIKYNTLLFKSQEIELPEETPLILTQKDRIVLKVSTGIKVFKNTNP